MCENKKNLQMKIHSEQTCLDWLIEWVSEWFESLVDTLIWVVSGLIDLSRVWKRTFENIQHTKIFNILKWMKMNESEWRREDEVEIPEEWNTTRLLKRPPRRGLFLRCWSLLQASCLLSACLCLWLKLLLNVSLCIWLQLAPRDIIIIFITIICICFAIHFGMIDLGPIRACTENENENVNEL